MKRMQKRYVIKIIGGLSALLALGLLSISSLPWQSQAAEECCKAQREETVRCHAGHAARVTVDNLANSRQVTERCCAPNVQMSAVTNKDGRKFGVARVGGP